MKNKFYLLFLMVSIAIISLVKPLPSPATKILSENSPVVIILPPAVEDYQDTFIQGSSNSFTEKHISA